MYSRYEQCSLFLAKPVSNDKKKEEGQGLGQLTFNYQCSAVQDLFIVKNAIHIKCTTCVIAIDSQCANQRSRVFISAGPVAILC